MSETRLGYIDLLRNNRAVRNLIVASGVSGTGDWLNWLATLFALTRVGEIYDVLGTIVIIHTGLPLVLMPVVGVVADRFDRRRLLIFCDLTRLVIVLGLFIGAWTGNTTLLWILVFLQYTVAAFHLPAAEALIQQLAAEDEVKTANALFATVFTGASAAGAMLGGVVVAVVGIEIAFLIDAATFAVSALLVFRIVGRRQSASSTTRHVQKSPSLWQHIRSEPRLRASFLAVAGVGVPAGLLWLIVVALGQQIAPLGENGAVSIGILNAVTFIAGMIGSAFFNQWFAGQDDLDQAKGAWRLTLIRCVSFVAVGVAPAIALVVGPPVGLAFACLAVGCVSLPGGALWVAGANFAQAYTPDVMRGRVFAVLNGIWTGGQAVTLFVATRAIGAGAHLPTVCFVMAGVVALMAATWLVIIARWPAWTQAATVRR